MGNTLYATPYVSEITGALAVIIFEAKVDAGRIADEQIDVVAIDNAGTFASAHDVPMSVLSTAFDKRFADGGRFRQVTNWDYPFRGDQIGCEVERTR